jgi:rubrerythrin
MVTNRPAADPRSPVVRGLRAALENEVDGAAFYRMAAAGASNDAARRLFTFLAEEEDRHFRVIREQAARLLAGKPLRLARPAASRGEAERFRSGLLDARDLAGAARAEGEVAALSIGMTLEKKTIRRFLALRKKAAGDPAGEAFFDGLVEWEREHLELLSAMYGALREEAWEEAGFWPF